MVLWCLYTEMSRHRIGGHWNHLSPDGHHRMGVANEELFYEMMTLNCPSPRDLDIFFMKFKSLFLDDTVVKQKMVAWPYNEIQILIFRWHCSKTENGGLALQCSSLKTYNLNLSTHTHPHSHSHKHTYTHTPSHRHTHTDSRCLHHPPRGWIGTKTKLLTTQSLEGEEKKLVFKYERTSGRNRWDL